MNNEKLSKRDKRNQFLAYKILFPVNDFLCFLHLPFLFTYDAHNKNIYFRVRLRKEQGYRTIYKKELFIK